MLHFTKRTIQPGLTALAIEGNIHCGPECEQLERAIEEMIAARQTRIILDMTAITHLDSAAIGAIVRCLTKLKGAGGGLRIAAAQAMIDYSLKLTKVDRVIQMFPTVDQAAQGFSSPEASPAQTA
jgi:anti-sigma B factor antagonist